MSERQALKTIGFWCNRTNDAYNMGEADWAKINGKDYLSGIASGLIDTGDMEGAAKAVESIASYAASTRSAIATTVADSPSQGTVRSYFVATGLPLPLIASHLGGGVHLPPLLELGHLRLSVSNHATSLRYRLSFVVDASSVASSVASAAGVMRG